MPNGESWKRYETLRQDYPELFANPSDEGIRIVSGADEIEAVARYRREMIARDSLPELWDQLGVVFEDEYILVVRDPVWIPKFNGYRTYLRIIEKPIAVEAVVMFATYKGDLVLLHHYRHALRRWSLELPRGLGSTGDWEEDARRELAEEVGGEADSLHMVGPLCANTGIFGTTANLVFVELTKIDTIRVCRDQQDPGIGKIELVPPERFLSYIVNGKVFDTYTLSAAYLVSAHRLDPRWVGGAS